MRRGIVGAALALSIAAAGCGSSTNATDYCREGVAAICSRLFDCDPQTAQQLYGSESGCVNQTNGQCTSTACPAGKTFDQSAADQCIASYGTATCSDLEHAVYPAVCNEVCK
ncbi:MAG TPA: hypothetical protein VFI53_19260 [Myxococcaceae bacterium]|nr:hypothetical protein [Myxococcaceae bacterium]